MIPLKVVLIASLLRAFLHSAKIFPGIEEWTEISSPLHSHKRIKEALFFEERGISPYAGWSYHGAPLLLPILRQTAKSQTLCIAPFVAVDLLTAWILHRIQSVIPQIAMPLSSLYLLNPFTILSSIACSTGSIRNLFVFAAIYAARTNKTVLAAAALASALYIDLDSLPFLLPLSMAVFQSSPFNKRRTVCVFVCAFIATASGLLFTSSLYLTRFEAHRHQSWYPSPNDVTTFLQDGGISEINQAHHWMLEVYGFGLKVEDLTPNMGLWWYFFTEMFPFYRSFFLFVFHSAIYVFTVPYCLAFSSSPLYALLLIAVSSSMFKPYPTVSDHVFISELCLVFPEEMRRIKWWWFLTVSALLIIVLEPVMMREWIEIGSANANFVFSINLLIAIWHVILLALLIEAGDRGWRSKEKINHLSSASASVLVYPSDYRLSSNKNALYRPSTRRLSRAFIMEGRGMSLRSKRAPQLEQVFRSQASQQEIQDDLDKMTRSLNRLKKRRIQQQRPDSQPLTPQETFRADTDKAYLVEKMKPTAMSCEIEREGMDESQTRRSEPEFHRWSKYDSVNYHHTFQ